MKSDFTQATQTPVDMVSFVMDNVFDWDKHQKHGGMRMSFEDGKTLVQSLQVNLRSICPKASDTEIFDLYGDLIHNKRAGDFQMVKALTEQVVSAYVEEDQGNPGPMVALKTHLAGKIRFMDKHFGDVGPSAELPTHVLSDAMESNDRVSEHASARGISSTVQQLRTIIDQGSGQGAGLARQKFPGIFKLTGR